LACVTKGSECIIAQKDKDIAFVQSVFALNGEAKNDIVWHTADDRGMYRPKEQLSLKGYVRVVKRDEKEAYEHLGMNFIICVALTFFQEIPAIQKLSWTLRDARKAEIVNGEIAVSSFYGSFDISLKLGTAINLGTCEIIFSAKYNNATVEHTHKFEVQEVNNQFYKDSHIFLV
jgi:hypothetical protein